MSAALDATAARAGLLPPGPRTPRAVQAMQRIWRYAEFSDRGHERYGDTFSVRVGSSPTAVLTRDREVIRRLYTGDPLGKRHGNDLLSTFLGAQSMLMLEPPEHLTRRKMLLPPFHGERVQSYARLMERLTVAELDRLRPGEVVKVQPIAQALTLDVILQAVFGISDVSMRKRLRGIFDALNTPLNSLALFVPQLTRRARWNLLSRRPWRLKDELNALLFEHIAATRADPRLDEREDILAMMVAARDEDGEGLSDEQLRDELITLIAAGHETTATATAWGVELLVHHPTVMARAGAGEDAYLEALVKEILRIRSPIPITSARHMLEPFTIGMWSIPPDVAVLVDAYGVHHDPRTYAEPHAFRPERFLEDPPDGYSFLPFGGGAHRCLGASLALLEMKVVLRELLARVELERTTDTLARPVPGGPTLRPRGGTRVRVLARRRDAQPKAARAALPPTAASSAKP
ncbi:MAG TPA: cytochrome P450 [Solirubrobacteraceae bacterium]|jgi:cytochrome P450|nr:cytochrome P450 [Solirubrobacteraceae bacterium]